MARAPQIEYTDNIEELVRQLRRAGVSLQAASAETINAGANFVTVRYKNNLKREFEIRNKFTLGAVKLYKAHGVRRSGELRKMRDINALVGVRKLKGGREHYLKKQEEGGTVRGMRKTGGKVPVPLNKARTSGRDDKPIASRYRINKANIRDRGDLRGMSPRKQYGAMRAMARRKAIPRGTLIQTDLGIFAPGKRKIKRVRSTEKRRIRLKKTPVFQKSVDALSVELMLSYFKKSARKLVKEANPTP